ncbi:hypothetical protein EVAR_7146_1 [Eumeta japonica]|uniref:Uncharacterized protein n=1 Tax=Eumeta variegata TaxID=151549 RepID=A0A4C1U6D2_EUMVA|nr:hypothetical protein EVAR_7146_1 [Eumeta japonica]
MLEEVSKEVHEEPWTRGHFGLTKTLGKLGERYFMNNEKDEVDKVRQIVPCLLGERENQPSDLLSTILLHGLLEKFGILIASMRRSMRANKYIIKAIEVDSIFIYGLSRYYNSMARGQEFINNMALGSIRNEQLKQKIRDNGGKKCTKFRRESSNVESSNSFYVVYDVRELMNIGAADSALSIRNQGSQLRSQSYVTVQPRGSLSDMNRIKNDNRWKYQTKTGSSHNSQFQMLKRREGRATLERC